MKQDVYERVTAKIVADLEQGVRPWMKPWNAEHAAGRITRPLRSNGIPYRGINIVMLWMEAMELGYSAPIWMTFKQALELGAHVRKGEKGSLVVYADTITRTEIDKDSGQESEAVIPFMKGYAVFNVEQIDGLPPQYPVSVQAPSSAPMRSSRQPERPSPTAAPWPAIRRRRTTFACRPSKPSATPKATTQPSRTRRHTGRSTHRALTAISGASAGRYAMEELVAELGAAFVCAGLAITPEVRDDHASYIASWLKVLKDDKRAVFTAARTRRRGRTT